MRTKDGRNPFRLGMSLGLFTLAASLILAGCSGTAPTAGGEGAAKPAEGAKALKVGVVFDRGGLGDKSFNDSAWRGLQRAKTELGIEDAKVESKEEKDYETNLSAMADQGMDLVIAVGINQASALKSVAPNYPDTKFAIVDGSVDLPNVRSLNFKEEEGSYLVGYAAGLATKTGKVGFVGGMELPLIEKFYYGFKAGVMAANPNAEVLAPKYTGSWDNVDTAKRMAEVLYDGGADVVYHAAGRAGLGVIRAAKERNLFAVGVDSDQDDEAPGNVLTSMIKRVDEAVFATIQDLKNGNFSAGTKVYDFKSNGVGMSDMRHTKDKIGAENMAKIDEAKKAMATMTDPIPFDTASFNAWAAARK